MVLKYGDVAPLSNAFICKYSLLWDARKSISNTKIENVLSLCREFRVSDIVGAAL